MTFPNQDYSNIRAFTDDYFDKLASAAASVDRDWLEAACELLSQAFSRWATVFVCGNGGSAAISNHLRCDYLKGIQTDTELRPKVISLSSNIETITAIGNDMNFSEIFVYQLRTQAEKGDVLITVSSSGDSENIVQACRWASENSVSTIAMTGFSGGRTSAVANINLHVEGDNYGIIEDVHQSLMHILAQYVRQTHMTPVMISERVF